MTAAAFDPQSCTQVVRVDGVERARHAVGGFDWPTAVSLAAENTKLYPGDLIAGPRSFTIHGLARETMVEIEVDEIGTLEQRVRG